MLETSAAQPAGRVSAPIGPGAILSGDRALEACRAQPPRSWENPRVDRGDQEVSDMPAEVLADDRLEYISLEITGRCQLECVHCYARSGPLGTHGAMITADWMRVMDQARSVGAWHVGFVGGEPTLHPDLAVLIEHALRCELSVEVFSNLVHVTDDMWDVLQQPGVALGTSYYSADSSEHDAVTHRRSHHRTVSNIREALRRGIPLRAAVIHTLDGQQVQPAVEELTAMGVKHIGVDSMREIGRGVRRRGEGLDQLCGRCGRGRLAVSPDGDVWPCLLSRWLVMGNVRDASLEDVI